MFRLCVLISMVGLMAAGAEAMAAEADRPQLCAGLVAGQTRTVARIIDAETVALDDGSELRLIGALAPRAMDVGADAGSWPLEIAAQSELAALILGRPVDIAFGGERTDRHGRLVAHAYWNDGGRRRWVQGHLLEQGLARAYVQAGNRACAGELLEAERRARERRLGLWADAAYSVRSAEAPLELSRYRGTFQIVEGRIDRVAQARGTIYVNFGKRRSAFAVSLRRGDRAILGASVEPKALDGKRVQVRGWIEQRQGPIINLSVAGLIEVLPDSVPGADAVPSERSGAPHPQAGEVAPPRAPERQPPGLIEAGR